MTVSNTTLNPLLFSFKNKNISLSSIIINIIPLLCGAKSICTPILEEEKSLLSEISSGQLRIRSGEEVRSFDFLTSNFGGILPRRPLPIVWAHPKDACSPLKDLSSSVRPGELFGVAVIRGNCSFDMKAYYVERLGASLMIVADMNDRALQRLGGKQPIAGGIGIPSIMVSTACAEHMLRNRVNTLPVTSKESEVEVRNKEDIIVTLIPSDNSIISDNWIDLAFTEWANNDDDLLTQIEGLIQKYTHKHPSNDVIS
eukprot:CAMPEP_0182434478 /NCGR_PEP_ID=MMETSP1167-20130531/69991_1 /TAXON_ID=2988 /ORGANISM="Mallomonas Sp, Strain CCMP3275" /LENGTH=255 /DNA_ID=CAMNT_0024624401 /DNA_START=360 /DNA_END=1124 /DNA_ORIENTATION=+